MFKVLGCILLVSFLSSCKNYYPLYKDTSKYKGFFQTLAITTDKNKSSLNIKKNLQNMLPQLSVIKYILFLETNTSTSSTVSNIDGKISGYEIETSVNGKLYKRVDYDILEYSFEEKAYAPYYLTSNEVLSTLSNRNKAIVLNTKNLSKKIYYNLMLYLSREKNYDN